jgi:hypothetical protein
MGCSPNDQEKNTYVLQPPSCQAALLYIHLFIKNSQYFLVRPHILNGAHAQPLQLYIKIKQIT